jgi:hypothetical protein
MNKGSFTQFVKGKTAHRFPKVATLAISSCVLVAMVAIDASASPNGVGTAIAGPSVHASATASESSLGQVFGFGHHHLAPVRATSTATATTTFTNTPVASSGGGGGGTGGGTTTTAAAPTTTTTPGSSTTTTPSSPPTTTTTAPSGSSSGHLITAGGSRDECLVVDGSGLPAVQAAVNSFESLTSTHVTCLGAYNNGASTWAEWDDPWVAGTGSAYTGWVAENPSVNQVVLEQDLIPSGLADPSNPLSWEQSCAAGDYDSYATLFGQNLVAAGLQNTVIRLGIEMNGPWENDFMGTTTQEQGLWATCFANEVTAIRQASGEHFLIDWNPNACYENVPFANYYPGNAYVDILGLDQYDVDCDAPTTAVSFATLAAEPGGLDSFEAFAAAQGKAMSFPEWGLDSSPAGDDPSYMDHMGSTIESGNFAFQEYFEVVDEGTSMLGTSTPLSVAEYTKWFASS